MFHQVNVDPMDLTALRFLWWTDDNLNIAVKAYQLTVRTFGPTSSPSVAVYALRCTARDIAQTFRFMLLLLLNETFMWTTCSEMEVGSGFSGRVRVGSGSGRVRA